MWAIKEGRLHVCMDAGYLEGHALLDLNFQEDSAGGPDCSLALHPNSDRLVLLQMDSRCGMCVCAQLRVCCIPAATSQC